MNLFRVCIALLAPAVLWFSACGRGPDFVANDEPWRADEERACLQMGVVRETPFIEARASLGGPSVCGALKPFSVAATARGTVDLRPPPCCVARWCPPSTIGSSAWWRPRPTAISVPRSSS